MTTTMSAPAAGYSINAKEAAKRLAVSVRTLDRMDTDGRLSPITRLGGRRKYDVAQVERVRQGLPAVPPSAESADTSSSAQQ